MFIQVIGTVTDVGDGAPLGRGTRLKPGATGYLGTKSVTDDGKFWCWRASSREAAEKNSARPEQGEWFAEVEKISDVTFHDTTRVELFGGGKNEASSSR
jgi:hypothetical protein